MTLHALEHVVELLIKVTILVGASTAAYQSLKTRRKAEQHSEQLDTIETTVNDKADKQNDRIDQLTTALSKSDTDIPPR